MRIFITGMTGFLGYKLANQLAKKGHKIGTLVRNVATSDRPTTSNTESMIRGEKRKGVSYYYGDLTDYINIYDTLNNFKPEVIIHLAAQTSVAYSFSHITEVFNVNFLGTVNMAEAARRAVPNIKKFIFSGSVEEYGIQEKFPTKETAELRAASPYGVAKIAAEKHLKYLFDAYDFPIVVFRNTNSYGRKYSHQFVIESIIYQMYRIKSTIKLGDPNPERDFIFESDLLNAYVLATETRNKKLIGESINIGTGEAISIRDLAKKITKITGYEGKIQWNSFPKRPLEIPRLQVDNTKAQKLLNWRPKISLDEGLRITSSYHKPN